MTDYLTLADVLAMHEDQIERYGGSRGVRDLGLLESALYRPQTGYYSDLIEEAAALWDSMAQNHPFISCLGRAKTSSFTHKLNLPQAFARGSHPLITAHTATKAKTSVARCISVSTSL